MPVVFVHGVAVRDPDDPQYAAVQRLTHGADWANVEAALREHVAPAVRPSAPERVALIRVYWGDLGAQRSGDIDDTPPQLRTPDTEPAAMTPDELGEALQHKLFEALPPKLWPAVVDAVWETVSEPALRAQLAARSPKRQATWLERQVTGRLGAAAPEVSRGLGHVVAELAAARHRNVRWAMGEARRPFHEVMPVFVGDALRYLGGRGVAGAPGPIAARVLAGLAEARDAECGAGEPLVVLSHSMGGQLVFDALTAFADTIPGGMPRVDFWCASGGQLGLFAQLGMFVADGDAALAGVPPERLGYLWNAWSSSDVLSFPAQGRVARAHDSDFAFTGSPVANHMAYLTDEAFYRTLAAMVRAHCRLGRGRERHGIPKYRDISD